MPTYRVEIGEPPEAGPLDGHEPTPKIRHVEWSGEAETDSKAKDSGYAAFRQKYGTHPLTALVRVTELWTIEDEPEVFADGQGASGYDGVWWKWGLLTAQDRTFVVVKAPRHVVMALDGLTERTREAVATRGKSEVELHRADESAPRVIELSRYREPRSTPRSSIAE